MEIALIIFCTWGDGAILFLTLIASFNAVCLSNSFLAAEDKSPLSDERVVVGRFFVTSIAANVSAFAITLFTRAICADGVERVEASSASGSFSG